MKKEITINFSYVKHEYLVRFFEENQLVKWEIADTSEEIQNLITNFYFPGPKEPTPNKTTV